MSADLTKTLADMRDRAERQAAAYAKMCELNGGVGKLGVEHPEMFGDMMLWARATENEHADTVLTVLSAVEGVLALHQRDKCGDCTECSPVVDYGIAWPCPTVKALTDALGAQQ